jgi:hypothetical protein
MNATLRDVYASKKTELLFKQENFDSKKKINRSTKKIDEEILSKIEKGITSEQLDDFQVPVFKYGGQITIHGVFPKTYQALRIGGYKNIFQNKNLSLGVKYDALDFEKKKRIYIAFRYLCGFHIEHSSKEYCAYKMIEVKDKEDALKQEAENKPFMDKIDIKLGSKRMYFSKVNYWGMIKYYLVMVIHINAIYEKDIPGFFLKTFGRSEADIYAEMKKLAEEKEVENNRLREEREKAEKIEKEKEKTLCDKEKARLSGLGYKITENIPVTAGLTVFGVKVTTSYSTKEQELIYTLFRFHKQPKAKLFQVARRTFSSLEEMQKEADNIFENWCDDKYRQDTVRGYILKQ